MKLFHSYAERLQITFLFMIQRKAAEFGFWETMLQLTHSAFREIEYFIYIEYKMNTKHASF